METIVRISNVHKNYPLGKTTVHALKGVDITISKGQFVSIAGPSGSGKSTLLNLIGCVDTPTSGTVEVCGANTRGLSDRELTRLRLEKIGFIFQSFNLIQVLDIRDNVGFPLLLRKDISRKEAGERVDHFIRMVGLQDHSRHRPNELSGGQRQRVAIARALVTGPELILADEPTANLDSETGEVILNLMREMNEKEKTTFVFSTHDPQVMAHAQTIFKLHDGLLSDRKEMAGQPS